MVDITGDASNETLNGSNDPDNITGGAGDDTITGLDGADVIDGGTGEGESLPGGASDDDDIFGGAGNDRLTGNSGNDDISGGADDDTISGDAGDPATQVEGDDTIDGGTGEDIIDGNGGNDVIDGGADNDTIDGGADSDTIAGGAGNDDIQGGADAAADTITGDGGNDTIDGGAGNDLIDGGTGDGESIPGGESDDDQIFGGAGDDTITGNDGDDSIDGGADDDVISGDDGDDTLDGGTGDDSLTGGTGNDDFIYEAGDGADTITDFGDETGPIDDGDQTNNDFVDLSDFYNTTTLDAVNAAGGDFGNELGLLRADAEDGTIDGVIGGVDYSTEIGDIDLTIENGGTPVTGTDLTFDNTNVPCFVHGTMIATNAGLVAVQDLKEGDKIVTRDNGMQEIRWIGSRKVAATDKMAPVKIAAGVLGNNEMDLWLSPNHRVLQYGWELDLLFETNEVLLPAKFLIGQDGVSQVSGGEVEYFHILFDNHEVILSNGAWTESFHPGDEGMGAFAEDVRHEILYLFPHLLEEGGFKNYGGSARLVLKAYEADILKASGLA